MMEKFELCFQREGREEWLIPELLAPDEPDDTGDFSDALRFEYHYDFLPSSVLPRFIVRTHHLPQTYYWRDGVVIEDGGNQARVRADIDDKKIKIEVSGNPNTRRDLLSKLRDQFAHIHHTLQGMVAKEMIPIPGYPLVPPVPYTFLTELENDGERTFRWEGVPTPLPVSELIRGVGVFTKPSFPAVPLPPPVLPKPAPVNLDEELKALSTITSVAEDNEPYLRQLARVVQESGLVPFVGAGMSLPVGLKSWTEALEYLYTSAEDNLTARQARGFGGAHERGALEEAAQILWEAMGDRWFNDCIHALFGRGTLSADKIKAAPVSLLPQLASGPVLTTNFDTVLETVYNNDFIDVALGDYRADTLLRRWDDKKHFLLKLHGDADESQGRVLTRAQYDRAYDEAGGSRLPELLRQLFSSRRPLLFLGCSLERDRTVAELERAGLQQRNAYHFALLKDPGEATRKRRHNDLVMQLGIQPLWLRDFDDIRPVLEFLIRVRK